MVCDEDCISGLCSDFCTDFQVMVFKIIYFCQSLSGIAVLGNEIKKIMKHKPCSFDINKAVGLQ